MTKIKKVIGKLLKCASRSQTFNHLANNKILLWIRRYVSHNKHNAGLNTHIFRHRAMRGIIQTQKTLQSQYNHQWNWPFQANQLTIQFKISPAIKYGQHDNSVHLVPRHNVLSAAVERKLQLVSADFRRRRRCLGGVVFTIQYQLFVRCGGNVCLWCALVLEGLGRGVSYYRERAFCN